ncbi:C39 family peptidase [Gabonibacter chumensis]|uniref:C39 family peptidase n=1 Tax=Gabonibacter chumensis TaxID=2972474 RepID=UPI0025726CEF|nr:C39 family peptidase [Gabonibacter chumensis]MCR9011408.1 C39 family peptidase [Gabonibacter chumensis]
MMNVKYIVACCFIILVCLSCQKSDTEMIQTDAESTWDNRLWEALQRDSVFMEMEKLMNNKTYYDQVYIVMKSTPSEQQESCIREMSDKRYTELDELVMQIKEKYDAYSFIYFQKLYDIVNKNQAKASGKVDYESEEIQVYGDCTYAIMTARDIMNSIYDLYSKFAACYPQYASTFKQRLINGTLFRNSWPYAEKRGLQVILSNEVLIKTYKCEHIIEIAKQLKSVGTYMTEIRDLLQEAIIYVRQNPDRPFPPQRNIGLPSAPREPGPRTYIVDSKDKLAKKNIKRTMSKQLKNTCVTSIMEYISDAYCGEGRNEGDFWLGYKKLTGEWISDNGVDSRYIRELVLLFFNTESFYDVKDAIDKKRVVMTTITSKIKDSLHNVLIVGYTSDGKRYIYMDPEVGYLQDAPVIMFSGSRYNISISGCK